MLMILLGVITVFMGYWASKAELTYKFAKLVPKESQESKYFDWFIETFGEDASVLVIGVNDPRVFEPENFGAYTRLIAAIDSLDGVDSAGVLSVANTQYLKAVGQGSRRKMRPERIFPKDLYTRSLTDSNFIKDFNQGMANLDSLRIFHGTLINPKSGAMLAVVPIKESVLNSKIRLDFVASVEKLAEDFTIETRVNGKEGSGIQTHFGGLPYVRCTMAGTVKDELNMFLWLSLIVTAIILWVFFRSLFSVIFPVIVIGMAVIWTMGSLVLFGFKISILSGLIPPIIVVIGIPNCIYLLNKYHQEFAKHGNKIKALSTIIRKIGIVTFITNFTTATGFLVLISADITILREFGIVAGVNVLTTFLISIIMIPAVFSFLPDPNTKQLKHLDFKLTNKLIDYLGFIVLNRRKVIYVVTVVIVIISGWGSWKIYSLSYLVDDIPNHTKLKKDLFWLEDNFKGVMPLEIVIKTKDPEGYKNFSTLRTISEFEKVIAAQPELSTPLSINTFLKASRQALYGNRTKYYDLPASENDEKLLLNFLNKSKGQANLTKNNNLMDSTGNIRVSVKMADIGSKKMDTLVNIRLKAAADSILMA